MSIKGWCIIAAVPAIFVVNTMTNREQLHREIAELLLSQKLAVLATQSSKGSAYASLIAFAATDDLQTLVLATPKATRKYANMKNNLKVSLLIN